MQLPFCSHKIIKYWQFHNFIWFNLLLIHLDECGAGENFTASSKEKKHVCVSTFTESTICCPMHNGIR